MIPKPPDHILAVPAYVPGKPVEELERERGVRDSIKLASNENPLGPSPLALEALRRAIADVHRYPDSAGFELSRALGAHLGLEASRIVLGNGSDDLIGMLTTAFLQPGDEVVMPQPSFLMYAIDALAAAARPVMVPLRELRTDLEAMAERVTARTRMVFINTPHNPTGHLVTRAELERFLDRLPENVMVVLDEAYIEFVRDPAGPDSRDYVRADRPVVGLRTFSKAYGLAGLRVGYGLMHPDIAAILNRVRQPFNVSLPAQAAAVAALADVGFLQETRRVVHAGIDYLKAGLDRLGLETAPSQANFLMFRVPGDARTIFESLLDRGVIVRPLGSYGYPDRLRVSVGRPEENRRFVAALGEVLADR